MQSRCSQRRQNIESIAKKFNPARAKRIASDIWREARKQDTPAVWQACEVAARHLREAGLDDVRIESMPTDGRTSAGGWLMPVAWEAVEARIEISASRKVLGDLSKNPLTLGMYSPSTPGEEWVEGGVFLFPTPDEGDKRSITERAAAFAKDVRGRFILVMPEAGRLRPDFNEWAFEQGALAVVSPHGGPSEKAVQYLNYAVPLHETPNCVPVFGISFAAGAALLGALEKNPDTKLRARAATKRYAGDMPMLTGSMGTAQPPVYLCGHIDEIGAQDNASGVAAAIEAIRALRSFKDWEQGRQIRFYFTTEVRGQQWWFNNQENPARFFGGLNIDMAGADAKRESSVVQLLTGFQHRPHFAGRLLLEAGRVADKVAGKVVKIKVGANYASDAIPGQTAPGGHVSIEQTTGPTYHSTDDTPDILNVDTFRWTGAAATAFLYWMTRLSNEDLLRLARSAKPNEAIEDPVVRGTRLATELATMRRAITRPNLYIPVLTPEALYEAGVNRRTGLWPIYGELKKFDAIVAGKLTNIAKPEVPPATKRSLVPLALSKGLVCFEDHIDPADIALLKRRTGLQPGWSTVGWVPMLNSFCDGKHTLEEIVQSLLNLGVPIELERARQVVLHLAERGLMRLRPILSEADLRKALRASGVKRGSILTVHASLSRFGYLLGGAAAMVQALLDVLGPKGTLVMPTHSNSMLGSPPYDPATSPSRTGAVTEYFRKLPGVLRGAHPTHSIAALGPAAEELVTASRPELTPLHRQGFWGKLCDMDGDVLLLCPIRSATIFHAGEAWLDMPLRNYIAHALDAEGKRQVYNYPNAPWHVDHFEEHFTKPLIKRGSMTVTTLGEGDMYLASARDMANISTSTLRRKPEIALGKAGACGCSFCIALKEGLKTWIPPTRLSKEQKA